MKLKIKSCRHCPARHITTVQGDMADPYECYFDEYDRGIIDITKYVETETTPNWCVLLKETVEIEHESKRSN